MFYHFLQEEKHSLIIAKVGELVKRKVLGTSLSKEQMAKQVNLCPKAGSFPNL